MEPAQTWSADSYARHARFVAELGGDVLALLDPRAGERILDLGCGDGVLTRRLADAGAVVVGADSSPDFVRAARELGIDARLVDGHALPFEREFDAVFSNAALHWMRRPADVLAGIARALRPGGRFVAEFGGFANVAAIRTALHAVLAHHGIDGAARDPWFFPGVEEYGTLLTAAGLRAEYLQLIPRPTPLPTALEGWLGTFANPYFTDIDPARRATLTTEVIALLRPILCDGEGRWTADYTRLRVRAVLP